MVLMQNGQLLKDDQLIKNRGLFYRCLVYRCLFYRYLVLCFALLSTCGVSVASQVSVTDYAGRLVALDKPATRIVTLAPHIVENIFSAGAGDLIVGTVSYSDYPETAKKIPRVGNIQGVSIESVVSLNPDLVIAWASGHSTALIQKLLDLGLHVYLDEPKTLEQVAQSIRDIGVLTGHQKKAEFAASAYLKKLKTLREAYQHNARVRMLYQVWDKPLRVISGNHIISDVIRLCGGHNVFANEPLVAPKVSIESVIDKNPQAIITSGMGQSRPEWLDAWLQWHRLSAVKNRHLFFVPPDLIQRHTVRILQGAEQLCQHLEQVRKIIN